MFADDLPKPKTSAFPKNLENLSVDELQTYITELESEIRRVEADMEKKKASRAAADAFFGGG